MLEIMLEDMEELFKIDQSSYCCGCFPVITLYVK